MQRRQFIRVLGGAVAVWPLAARREEFVILLVGRVIVAPEKWSPGLKVAS
jgi:hypothetical protein